MKKLPAFYLLIIPVILLFFITGCKKDTNSNLPLLSTVTVSSIDSTSAISGGNIFSEGGDSVTARGVCWSTNPIPILTDNATIDGKGTGSFSSSIKGLVKGTLYYVRAYATNGFGTAYGQIVPFITLGAPPVIISSVQTLEATNVTNSSATLNATVDNADVITDVSFEYGLTNMYGSTIPAVLTPVAVPTMPGVIIPNGLAFVSAQLLGLMPYTTYHFRVKVANGQIVTYGDEFVFTTTY